MIALFLAEGNEEIEALTVVDLCRRAGLDIQTVSVTGQKQVRSSHGILVEADMLLEDVDFSQVDMLVLPGGMPGTLNLEACVPLMEQVKAFHQAGKYISAICAAPTVFGRAGILEGREACCYPEMEGDLLGAKVSYAPVVEDGHILTSRGMGTAIPFGLAIVARFKGQDYADELAKKIVFSL